MAEDDGFQVGLAEAIAKVRQEFEDAIAQGTGSAVAFRPGPIDMEFQVGFSKNGSADAGVRLGVLSIGTRGEIARSATHRLKLTLTPVDRSGGDQLISDVGER